MNPGIKMKTAQEVATELHELVDLHTHAYDVCNRAYLMLHSQVKEIERLQADLTTQAEINRHLARENAAERDALKADAERWKTIKPHFYFDNEGSHEFWNCSISSESWTVDGVVPDAAIDAMKGKS